MIKAALEILLCQISDANVSEEDLVIWIVKSSIDVCNFLSWTLHITRSCSNLIQIWSIYDILSLRNIDVCIMQISLHSYCSLLKKHTIELVQKSRLKRSNKRSFQLHVCDCSLYQKSSDVIDVFETFLRSSNLESLVVILYTDYSSSTRSLSYSHSHRLLIFRQYRLFDYVSQFAASLSHDFEMSRKRSISQVSQLAQVYQSLSYDQIISAQCSSLNFRRDSFLQRLLTFFIFRLALLKRRAQQVILESSQSSRSERNLSEIWARSDQNSSCSELSILSSIVRMFLICFSATFLFFSIDRYSNIVCHEIRIINRIVLILINEVVNIKSRALFVCWHEMHIANNMRHIIKASRMQKLEILRLVNRKSFHFEHFMYFIYSFIV